MVQVRSTSLLKMATLSKSVISPCNESRKSNIGNSARTVGRKFNDVVLVAVNSRTSLTIEALANWFVAVLLKVCSPALSDTEIRGPR